MGYQLDISEVQRMIKINITKELTLIDRFIDFYLLNKELEDKELYDKYISWLGENTITCEKCNNRINKITEFDEKVKI